MKEMKNENTVSQVSPMINQSLITGKIKKPEDLGESLEQIQAERRKFRAARMGRANRGKALSTKIENNNKGGIMPMNENNWNYDEEDILEESVEGNILINEAILEESNIELTDEEFEALVESEMLSERSIVRLDRVAKRSLAEKKALIVIAKEKNDPLYRELVKIYKRKRKIIDKIDKKYGSQAIQRVRKNRQGMKNKGIMGFLKGARGESKQTKDVKAPNRNMPMNNKPNKR